MSASTKLAFVAEELVTTDKLNAISRAQSAHLVYTISQPGVEFENTTQNSDVDISCVLTCLRTKYVWLYVEWSYESGSGNDLLVTFGAGSAFNMTSLVGGVGWYLHVHDVVAGNEVGEINYTITLTIRTGSFGVVKVRNLQVFGTDDLDISSWPGGYPTPPTSN